MLAVAKGLFAAPQVCPWLECWQRPRRPPVVALLPPQLPVLRQIVQEEGMGALWRGWKPRVLFHVPAAAVCWGTYESVKALLKVP